MLSLWRGYRHHMVALLAYLQHSAHAKTSAAKDATAICRVLVVVRNSLAFPLQNQLQAFTVDCQVHGQTATSSAAHLCEGDPKPVAVPEDAGSWADTTPALSGKPAEVL